MRIAKHVESLEAYVPGEQPKDANVVKLNTNENPYPPSPKTGDVLRGFDLDRLRRYPDPNFRLLRERLAEIHSTVPERIFVGNGSDEILTLAARAFVEDDGLIASMDPSYSLYRTLAAIRDVRYAPVPLSADFTCWGAIPEGVSLFLLTNPNAPTGVRYLDGEVEKLKRELSGGVLLIDEAYADFSGRSLDFMAAAGGNDNTIVMRTLSKSYSLAGLRLGYAIGPEDLIEALYKVKDSYNVDAVAQAVALAALNDIAWMEANTAKVVATRERFIAALAVRGWDTVPSSSNFIFTKPPRMAAEDVFQKLREMRIFVRYFKGPRTGDRLRITIGTDADMDRLLEALDGMGA